MSLGPAADREPARFYTRSRKFPRMIGRLPEGTRIWGGPYTLSQLAIAALTVAVAATTRPVWSLGSIVLDLLAVGAAAWGAALAARAIPASHLNPAVVVAAVVASALAPRGGSYRGRALPRSRPSRWSSR